MSRETPKLAFTHDTHANLMMVLALLGHTQLGGPIERFRIRASSGHCIGIAVDDQAYAGLSVLVEYLGRRLYNTTDWFRRNATLPLTDDLWDELVDCIGALWETEDPEHEVIFWLRKHHKRSPRPMTILIEKVA